MRLLVAILLTSLLSFVAGLFFPWWSLAIAAFLVAVIVQQRSGKAFLAGFLGVFLLWGLLAFIIDTRNEGYLSARIAELLPLGGKALLLILVTAFIGGLVGGFGAMTGSFLRSVNKPVIETT
jgi:hypothetical protein